MYILLASFIYTSSLESVSRLILVNILMNVWQPNTLLVLLEFVMYEIKNTSLLAMALLVLYI